MPKFHPAHLRAKTFHAVSGLALVALLSACGSQPEATNAGEAPIENAANVVDNAAVNEAANTVATPAPVNIAEAPVAKVEAPATPVAAPAVAPAPAKADKVETAAAAPGGDAANGAKLFAQCKICHSVEPGKNGLGPSLHNINGRKAAMVEGFTYSPAMKDSGITWTDAALSEYLRAPMKLVPGTKMAFGGIANDKNRADVIAYLDTLK